MGPGIRRRRPAQGLIKNCQSEGKPAPEAWTTTNVFPGSVPVAIPKHK
jgi:hypothetical protein